MKMKKLILFVLVFTFTMIPSISNSQDKKDGKFYLGLKGTLIPSGSYKGKISIMGSSESFPSEDYDLSYGPQLILEYRLKRYLGVGLEAGYLLLKEEYIDGHTGLANINPYIRVIAPKESLEIYFKLAPGFSIGILPEEVEEEMKEEAKEMGGKADIKRVGYGWNLKFLGGIMFRTGDFGVFIEPGYQYASWKTSGSVSASIPAGTQYINIDEDFDLEHTPELFLLNIGIVTIF